MTESVDTPLLLLDIDGVLLTINEQRPLGARRYQANYFRFYYPCHRGWLRPLLEQTEGWWLTSHRDKANEVGRVLGLPPMGWVQYDLYREPGVYDRAAAIDELFPGRPVIWVDDDHTHFGAHNWAKNRNTNEAPTLLIEPDGDVGLERHHISQMNEWLGELSVGPRPA